MEEIKVHGVYRHFKGDYYLVEGIAKNADDLRLYVVYRALYGEGEQWIRPVEDFLGKVNHEKNPDVTQENKFELQNILSKRHG